MTSGVSGMVRIMRLTGPGLAAAEAHGKRLDATGQARSVYDAAPVTSSGLDLRDLYDQHVEGAFVPGGATKALHLLVRFPDKLVDGEQPDQMLRLAREYAGEVFGKDAVFADRIDRDEKGRHVVDLFVVPKYEKVTKHTTKVAVSTTRHLKQHAVDMKTWDEGKQPATLRAQGRALQTSFHEFLVDHGIDAERGKTKITAGSDWKSAEELEAARIRRDADNYVKTQTRQLDDREVQLIEREKKVAGLDHREESVERDLKIIRGDRVVQARAKVELEGRGGELDQRETLVRQREQSLTERDEALRARDGALKAETVSTELLKAKYEALVVGVQEWMRSNVKLVVSIWSRKKSVEFIEDPNGDLERAVQPAKGELVEVVEILEAQRSQTEARLSGELRGEIVGEFKDREMALTERTSNLDVREGILTMSKNALETKQTEVSKGLEENRQRAQGLEESREAMRNLMRRVELLENRLKEHTEKAERYVMMLNTKLTRPEIKQTVQTALGPPPKMEPASVDGLAADPHEEANYASMQYMQYTQNGRTR